MRVVQPPVPPQPQQQQNITDTNSNNNVANDSAADLLDDDSNNDDDSSSGSEYSEAESELDTDDDEDIPLIALLGTAGEGKGGRRTDRKRPRRRSSSSSPPPPLPSSSIGSNSSRRSTYPAAATVRDSPSGTATTATATASTTTGVSVQQQEGRGENSAAAAAAAAAGGGGGSTTNNQNIYNRNQRKQQYTFVSSAYFQTLSEISYTILNDSRWTTTATTKAIFTNTTTRSNGDFPQQQGIQLLPLFRWEYGDDLSAVHVFGRRYAQQQQQQLQQQRQSSSGDDSNNFSCTCLLCRDGGGARKREEGKQQQQQQKEELVGSQKFQAPGEGDGGARSNATSTIDTTNNKDTQTTTTTTTTAAIATTAINSDPASEEEDEDNEEEDDDDRALYLYARLFYRKGPWFRLDDVYSRYYAPSPLPSSPPPNTATDEKMVEARSDGSNTAISAAAASNNNSNSDDSRQQAPLHQPKATASSTTSIKENTPPRQRSKRSKSNFFRPVNSENNPRRRRSSLGQKTAEKEDGLLERHLQSVANMIEDCTRLTNKGLIRSFHNEEECGKTVGSSRSILSTTEQNAVLSRLGGRATTAASRIKKSAVGTSQNGRKSPATSTTSNEIWKQMSSQTTIFGKRGSVLPVIRHVDDVVIDNVARKIAEALRLASSGSSRSSSSNNGRGSTWSSMPNNRRRSTGAAELLRRQKRTIKARILSIMNYKAQQQQQLPLLACGCFPLREEPALTLRRCIRLYLCATSGPGEMRGDGDRTNGWRSLMNNNIGSGSNNIPLANLVPPPGIHSFNQVFYPNLAYRFGLPQRGPSSCFFIDRYRHLPNADDHDEKQDTMAIHHLGSSFGNDENCERCRSRTIKLAQDVQVFAARETFLAWEVCVELRANVDYLMELNEMFRYTERHRGNGNNSSSSSSSSYGGEAAETASATTSVDFLRLLTTKGREKILAVLLAAFKDDNSSNNNCTAATSKNNLPMENVKSLIQSELDHLCHLQLLDDNDYDDDDDVVVIADDDDNDEGENDDTPRKKEWERILIVVAIMCTAVLLEWNAQQQQQQQQPAATTTIVVRHQRPWLRHLHHISCLAYILYDLIPILESSGLYRLAIVALETLLFGNSTAILMPLTCSYVPPPPLPSSTTTAFSPLLFLSRRARGKAYERLVIDLTHLHRSNMKKAIAEESQQQKGSRPRRGRSSSSKKQQQKRPPSSSSVNNNHNSKIFANSLEQFCRATVEMACVSSDISFSSIRTIAKKIKKRCTSTTTTTTTTLQQHCLEARELGLRLEKEKDGEEEEDDDDDATTTQQSRIGYWKPITDHFVANAISKNEDDDNDKGNSNSAGVRCSFIGFEDEGDGDKKNAAGGSTITTSSLNVEQLAMELYYTGRLPAPSTTAAEATDYDDPTGGGGWLGWHDEVCIVRALFRIICSAPVLGMDWGCCNRGVGTDDDYDPTIFLTPYQGAPNNLHVGFSSPPPSSNEGFFGGCGNFYYHRRDRIQSFLEKLSVLDGQGLCDLVYESVQTRLRYLTCRKRKDPSLEHDIKRVRTLSLIAAGCGGRQLAAICRCLFYDYRHYSGGLPDLLLVRAMTQLRHHHQQQQQQRNRLLIWANGSEKDLAARHGKHSKSSVHMKLYRIPTLTNFSAAERLATPVPVVEVAEVVAVVDIRAEEKGVPVLASKNKNEVRVF